MHNLNNNNKVKSRLKYNNYPTQYSRLHASSIAASSILHEINKKKVPHNHLFWSFHPQNKPQYMKINDSPTCLKLISRALVTSDSSRITCDVHPVHILSVFLKSVDINSWMSASDLPQNILLANKLANMSEQHTEVEVFREWISERIS